MTRLLAIDTASEVCSAALLANGQLIERALETPREHGPIVLGMVDELLAEAGLVLASLDALAFGRGPGSFTGVRIAAGISQGLALAADLPVIPVSDLAMLAQAAMDENDAADNVAVCLDARMGEAYVGFFSRDESGFAVARSEEALLRPQEIEFPAGQDEWLATGPGWKVFEGLSRRLGLGPHPAELARRPHARAALRLAPALLSSGRAVPAEEALPVYLREQVAWKRSGA